jgi:hypothetical protein
MRGFLQPALRPTQSDAQTAFFACSRGRRSKLARAAQTNLTVAHQWARGEAVQPATAEALDSALRAYLGKKRK